MARSIASNGSIEDGKPANPVRPTRRFPGSGLLVWKRPGFRVSGRFCVVSQNGTQVAFSTLNQTGSPTLAHGHSDVLAILLVQQPETGWIAIGRLIGIRKQSSLPRHQNRTQERAISLTI